MSNGWSFNWVNMVTRNQWEDRDALVRKACLTVVSMLCVYAMSLSICPHHKRGNYNVVRPHYNIQYPSKFPQRRFDLSKQEDFAALTSQEARRTMWGSDLVHLTKTNVHTTGLIDEPLRLCWCTNCLCSQVHMCRICASACQSRLATTVSDCNEDGASMHRCLKRCNMNACR